MTPRRSSKSTRSFFTIATAEPSSAKRYSAAIVQHDPYGTHVAIFRIQVGALVSVMIEYSRNRSIHELLVSYAIMVDKGK